MREPRFFEGDFVLLGSRPMLVLVSDEARRQAHCVWYEGERRCTGLFGYFEMEMLAPSALRAGYRLIRAPH